MRMNHLGNIVSLLEITLPMYITLNKQFEYELPTDKRLASLQSDQFDLILEFE